MKKLQEMLKSHSSAVRSRPGMFFGNKGERTVELLSRFIDAVLRVAKKTQPGPITVWVKGSGRRQIILVEFLGLTSGMFSPTRLRDEDVMLLGTRCWEVDAAIGACNRFILDFCDGKLQTRVDIRDGWKVSVKTSAANHEHGLRAELRPVFDIFGSLSHEDLYYISGYLRDQSLLRPSTATRLCADSLKAELSFFYRQGLRSLMFEEDYTRWPSRHGCLSFKGSTKGMKVEGYLRFVHAGVPFVRNYVNFRPTHGGAHLEGLGDALLEVFPDPSLGCRKSTLVTNPDSGTCIKLPHPFIGAMHLQTDRPRYYGPTRDVLFGDDVREFVRLSAADTLKKQWHAST